MAEITPEQELSPQNTIRRRRRRPRHVCLFGISADPPTGTSGHVGIVQQLLDHFSFPTERRTRNKTTKEFNVKENTNNGNKNFNEENGKKQEPNNGDDGDNPEDVEDETNASNTTVDEIRVVPVYKHTYGNKQDRLISFDHRVEMCRMAFSHLSPNVVNITRDEHESWKRADAAQRLADRNHCSETFSVGTAALLEYLQETEPDTRFSFCLGADSFTSLMAGKWKESSRVKTLLEGRFIVVNRTVEKPKQDSKENPSAQKKRDSLSSLEELVDSLPEAQLLPPNPALGDISSSQIRSLLQDSQEREVLVSEILGRKHHDIDSTETPTSVDHDTDGKKSSPKKSTMSKYDESWIVPLVLEYIEKHGLYLESSTE